MVNGIPTSWSAKGNDSLRFALRLEADDGTITEVPVDFDLEDLTGPERAEALDRWDKVTPEHLAASLLFARTRLPATEWPTVGPVLQGVIEGDIGNVEVTHGL